MNPIRTVDRGRWKRPLAVTGLLALIAAMGSVAPGPRSPSDTCSGRPCIQVGTFNLYWLGSKNRSDGLGLRTDEDVRRLVELIVDDLDIEIVVFQEVNTSISEVVGNETVKSTDQFGVLKQELEGRGYELFALSFSANAQNVVIAYDTDEVERKDRRTLLVPTSFDFGDGCTSSNQRLPLAVKLQAGALSFWVVGVHLKSQIGGECADRVRERQATNLKKAIRKQLDAKKGHVFIAGDFNALASEPSLKPLKSKGKFTPLTRRANRGAGSGSVSFLKDPFRSLIDHVMYRKRDSKKAWVKKSTLVFDPDTAGDQFSDYVSRYSDHAPVYTSFYTDRE